MGNRTGGINKATEGPPKVKGARNANTPTHLLLRGQDNATNWLSISGGWGWGKPMDESTVNWGVENRSTQTDPLYRGRGTIRPRSDPL